MCTESIIVWTLPKVIDVDLQAEGNAFWTRSHPPALDAKMRRGKRRGTEATLDAIAGLTHVDTAKALVMTYVGQLVADGYAEWDMLESGDVHLRCRTGETFLLAE